ncbi:DUF4270 domain-containing protein [Rhodothermus marinus]|uniref:DUF4270 domain-containing protein n=1 Tax=Rhodothermus marinus TaxID=29549 RepID=UPI0012BA42D4|nr:DUF4270 domain-containing protein [Rhodothermus marinus]BBM70005.1 hypothetical protein RmaAA213_18510 [Rhodothermus marinus]
MRRSSVWSCCALLLLLATGCDDPSAVGIGLIGEEGLPVTVRLPADSVLVASQKDRTGNTSRVLAGRVADPLTGTLAATGYVDFVMSGTARVDTTIVGVRLELPGDYVYGDTLGSVTLALHDMTEDWPYAGVGSDTTLSAGPPVRTFTFAPTDTLVQVDLPAEWIAAHDTTFQSNTFSTSFHGFQLAPGEGNAVVGFRFSDIRLLVFTVTDTVTLTASKVLTTVTRESLPSLPSDRVLLQDGLGQVVRLRFNFAADSVREAGLHAAVLEVPIDSVQLKQTPAGFVRPLPATVRLIGVNAEGNVPVTSLGEPIVLATTTPDGGRLRFRLGSTSLQTLQRLMLGETPVQYLQLEFPTDDNTLSPLLLYAEPTLRPTLILMVTPPSP